MSETPALITHTANQLWTVDDLQEFPDDGKRYELIEGILLVSPSPAVKHQLVTSRLVSTIRAQLPSGVDVVETIAVSPHRHTELEPDVVIAPMETLLSDAVRITPDTAFLVVEVVSRSSRTMDRITKPAVYAEMGVPNFWRVEFLRRPVPEITAYQLVGAEYVEKAKTGADGVLEVAEPFPLHIRAADLVAPR